MKSLDFFNLPNPSNRIMACTRNLSGGKARPALKADNHSAIYGQIV
jgi:hypothetical protein